MSTVIETDPVADDLKQSDDSNLTNGNKNEDVVFAGKVVQVTNVSPGSTLQQLATLFGFLGNVTDIRLYPSDDSVPVAVKICYIKYQNSEQCGVAQHLTNTVFIDKPLIVVPLNREEIPEEVECEHLIKTVNAYAAMAATGYLSQAFPTDESTSSIPGLPPPPVITSTTDPVEIDETKKTIFVDNIHESISSEQLMAFFSGVGEVKYIRFCKTEEGKYAYVEFTALESVPTAIQYNGVIFGSHSLKVVHAKTPIVKPESERISAGRTPMRTVRDVVKRPNVDRLGLSSRSRSPPSRRSGSRSRYHRSRSRSRSPRRRRRSRTRSPRRRRSRSRSKSPRKRRSRSRTRSPRRRKSRSRSRERRRRRKSKSRSPSRSPKRRPRRKSRSKSRSPVRKKSARRSNSKSPDRSSSTKKKKEKEKEKDRHKEKSKAKDLDEDGTEKELNSLLTKIYTFEEEQEKEKKSKEKESSDESSSKKKKRKDSS